MNWIRSTGIQGLVGKSQAGMQSERCGDPSICEIPVSTTLEKTHIFLDTRLGFFLPITIRDLIAKHGPQTGLVNGLDDRIERSFNRIR